MPSGDFIRAVTLLRLGDPVPVDVIARLVERGHDFSAMEEQYGLWPFFNRNHPGVDTNG